MPALISLLASCVTVTAGLLLIRRAVAADNAMPLLDEEECW